MRRAGALLAAAFLAACGAAAPPDALQADVTLQACGLNAGAIGQFVNVPAGQYRKGAYAVYPEEAPGMILHIAGFEMVPHEVNNAEFARFTEETGYLTTAERSAAPGGPGAGSAVFRMPAERAVPTAKAPMAGRVREKVCIAKINPSPGGARMLALGTLTSLKFIPVVLDRR